MPVIKRASIQSGTLKLKQLRNDSRLSDNEFKYVVEFPDGDRVLAGFTRAEGKQAFDRIKRNRSQTAGMFGSFF